MGWREAWRWSGLAFQELSLQAIYAFRQGSIAPAVAAHDLVPGARRRVLQGKFVVGAALTLLAAGAALLARAGPGVIPGVTIAPGAFSVGVVTGLLSLEVTFLWWTGLQILPTFLSSRILEVLTPLPISAATFRRVAALLYLRLFDLPIGVVLVATPVFLSLALGWRAGIAVLPGVLGAVAFALALSLLTGRFFSHRVLGSRGGGGRTAVRWAYLVLWVAPAFALVGFVTAAPAFFGILGPVAAGVPSLAGSLLLMAFPVPFGALVAIAAPTGAGIDLTSLGRLVVVLSATAYAVLAASAALWVYESVGEIGTLVPSATRSGPAPRGELRPQRPAWAVMTKDLRLASRTPGFAFLVLLPVLDAFALGLLTYVRAGPQAASTLALGAVTAAALLATFFGPAFFAIEVVAYSYGRTLPLAERSIIVGKTTLVASIYLVAGAIVLGLDAVRFHAPLVFAGFVVAELPAVVAAALLELGLLFRWARHRGTPVPNLYAGAWNAFAVTVPGLAIAAAPLAFDASSGLASMALVSLAELAVVAPLVLGGRGS
jgi:hypothetical protein